MMQVTSMSVLGKLSVRGVAGKLIAIVVLASLALVATGNTQGATLTYTFKDGSPTPFIGGTYTGTQDTTLSNTSATTNIGSSVNMWVGDYTGGLIRRTLLRFDVSALTAAQFYQAQSITLNLFPSSLADTGNGGNTLQVYGVSAANGSWIEGSGNFSAAAAGEPSWNLRSNPSTSWAGSAGLSTSGTDYVNTLLSSAAWTTSTPLNTPLGGGLSFTGSSAQLTSLINDWLNVGNAGLLLNAPVLSAGQRLLILHSADSASAAFRPELVITFETVPPVPEPATIAPIMLGVVCLFKRRRQLRNAH